MNNSLETKVGIEKLEYIKNNIFTEGSQIDFKEFFIFSDQRSRLELIKDIVSFANTDGGYIVYGVSENDGEFDWVGLDNKSDKANDIMISDVMTNYVSDLPKFVISKLHLDGDEFYLLYVEKFSNKDLIKFIKDGEYSRKKGKSEKMKIVFHKYQEYGRLGSQNRDVTTNKAFKKLRINEILTNIVEENAPYDKYINRAETFDFFLEKFKTPTVPIVQINGLGGIGKSSFVWNFCTKLLNDEIEEFTGQFKSIIWITGKMDVFQSSGEIEIIRDTKISFEEVVDIFETVFEIEIEEDNDKVFDVIVNKLIEMPSLLIFDNMETIQNKGIIKLLTNLPPTSKAIITTREDIQDISYSKVVIDGFKEEEFDKYVNQQINVHAFSPESAQSLTKSVSSNMASLFQLTHGSPIITNLIINRICSGEDMEVLLSQLRTFTSENDYYDRVMDFCFKDTLGSLSVGEKSVLFVLSATESEDDVFTTDDLVFILNNEFTKHQISDIFSKLHSISFCSRSENGYSSHNLIKVFSNSQLSNDDSIETEKIVSKLREFEENNKSVNHKYEALYEKTKAYTFSQKQSVANIRNSQNEYRINENIGSLMQVFREEIERHPSFSFLYFELANQYIQLDNEDLARKNFELAIKYDARNSFYFSEFGFFEFANSRTHKAIVKFQSAIKIDETNHNAHNGLALCLKKNAVDKGIQNCTFEEKNQILYHFNKAYKSDRKYMSRKSNARNSHAHAHFLVLVKDYNSAKKACLIGLDSESNNRKLISLLSKINRELSKKNNETRNVGATGIFSGLSDKDLNLLNNKYITK